MIEVELKFKFPHEQAVAKLNELNANFNRTEFNSDIYYLHPSRNFIETDEALRIRQVGDKIELTYKGPKIGNHSKSREELNVEFKNLESLQLILTRLGFEMSGEVYKSRQTWYYSDIIVTLDNIRGLGEYIELETEARDKKEMKENLGEMQTLVSSLGLKMEDQIKESYLSLLQKQNSSS